MENDFVNNNIVPMVLIRTFLFSNIIWYFHNLSSLELTEN